LQGLRFRHPGAGHRVYHRLPGRRHGYRRRLSASADAHLSAACTNHDGHRHLHGAHLPDHGVGDRAACCHQSSRRRGPGADLDGGRRDRRAVRRACGAADPRRVAAAVPRPFGTGSRNAFRISTRDPAGRSLLDQAGRRRAMRWPQIAALAAAAAVVATEPAAAERLVASLSNRHVMITSNYTGVELVLFGSIERDASNAARTNPYDIVATVIGPRETLRLRHSQRMLGIWVNTAAR